jgi:hypothetical protein
MVRRTVAMGLAAVPAVLAEANWHTLAALILAVAVVAVVVMAVCWAIADAGRTRRLVSLISAWRGASAPLPSPRTCRPGQAAKTTAPVPPAMPVGPPSNASGPGRTG